MDFLYFPKDKSEYIPGLIWVVIIIIASAFMTWFIIRLSRKQLEKAEQEKMRINEQMGREKDKKSE